MHLVQQKVWNFGHFMHSTCTQLSKIRTLDGTAHSRGVAGASI